MLPLLLDCALKGTALLVLAFVGMALFQKASAAPRHLYWCCVLVGLLALPVLSMLLPGWHILPRWAAGPEAAQPAAAAPTAPADLPPAPMLDRPTIAPAPVQSADPLPVAPTPAPASPSRAPATTPTRVASGFVWPSWEALLTWTYLIGLFVALFPVAAAYLLLARLSRGIDLPEWSPLLHELRATIGVKRHVYLIRGFLPSMPLTWGFFRPVIEERRRCVLLHELAHIRRHDALSFLLARLACALYWFHPLAWLAAARLRAASELACDDMVLATGTKSSTYAAELVTLAESSAASRVAPYAAIAMARVNKPSQLHARIKAILDTTRRRGRLTRTAILTGVMVALGCLLPLACMKGQMGHAIQPPPLSAIYEHRDWEGRQEVTITGESIESYVAPFARLSNVKLSLCSEGKSWLEVRGNTAKLKSERRSGASESVISGTISGNSTLTTRDQAGTETVDFTVDGAITFDVAAGIFSGDGGVHLRSSAISIDGKTFELVADRKAGRIARLQIDGRTVIPDPFTAIVETAIAAHPAQGPPKGGEGGWTSPSGLDFSALLQQSGQAADFAAFPKEHVYDSLIKNQIAKLTQEKKIWALAALLNHESPDAQIDAARALVACGDPHAVPALLAAAKANNYNVDGSENATIQTIYRGTLKQALEKLTGLQLTPRGLHLTDYPKPNEPHDITSDDHPERFGEEIAFERVDKWLADKYLPASAPAAGAETSAAGPERAAATFTVQLVDATHHSLTKQSIQLLPVSVGPELVADKERGYWVDAAGTVSLPAAAAEGREFFVSGGAFAPAFVRFDPSHSTTAELVVRPADARPTPDLNIRPTVTRAGDDYRIDVSIDNNTDTPYTLTPMDLCLQTESHVIYPPKGLAGGIVPPKGRGALTLTLAWSDYLHAGKWIADQRFESWKGPVGPTDDGMEHYRVAVRGTSSVPVVLPDPIGASWGKAVEGIQLRLRPALSTWNVDPHTLAIKEQAPDHPLYAEKWPELQLDVRNTGTRSPEIEAGLPGFSMELDGQNYRCAGPVNTESTHLAPGQSIDDISVPLDAEWQPKLAALVPGKHTVRAILRVDTHQSFEVFSNTATVEIAAGAPATAPAAAHALSPALVDPDDLLALRAALRPLNGWNTEIREGRVAPVGLVAGNGIEIAFPPANPPGLKYIPLTLWIMPADYSAAEAPIVNGNGTPVAGKVEELDRWNGHRVFIYAGGDKGWPNAVDSLKESLKESSGPLKAAIVVDHVEGHDVLVFELKNRSNEPVKACPSYRAWPSGDAGFAVYAAAFTPGEVPFDPPPLEYWKSRVITLKPGESVHWPVEMPELKPDTNAKLDAHYAAPSDLGIWTGAATAPTVRVTVDHAGNASVTPWVPATLTAEEERATRAVTNVAEQWFGETTAAMDGLKKELGIADAAVERTDLNPEAKTPWQGNLLRYHLAFNTTFTIDASSIHLPADKQALAAEIALFREGDWHGLATARDATKIAWDGKAISRDVRIAGTDWVVIMIAQSNPREWAQEVNALFDRQFAALVAAVAKVSATAPAPAIPATSPATPAPAAETKPAASHMTLDPVIAQAQPGKDAKAYALRAGAAPLDEADMESVIYDVGPVQRDTGEDRRTIHFSVTLKKQAAPRLVPTQGAVEQRLELTINGERFPMLRSNVAVEADGRGVINVWLDQPTRDLPAAKRALENLPGVPWSASSGLGYPLKALQDHLDENPDAVLRFAYFREQSTQEVMTLAIGSDGKSHGHRDVFDYAMQGGDQTPFRPEDVQSALAVARALPAAQVAFNDSDPSNPSYTYAFLVGFKDADRKPETREYDIRRAPPELMRMLETLRNADLIRAATDPAWSKESGGLRARLLPQAVALKPGDPPTVAVEIQNTMDQPIPVRIYRPAINVSDVMAKESSVFLDLTGTYAAQIDAGKGAEAMTPEAMRNAFHLESDPIATMEKGGGYMLAPRASITITGRLRVPLPESGEYVLSATFPTSDPTTNRALMPQEYLVMPGITYQVAARTPVAPPPAPTSAPAPTPATGPAAHLLELRLLLPADDKTTPADVFPNPDQPGETLRLSKEPLADETMLESADVRNRPPQDVELSLWLDSDTAWRILALQKQVGSATFRVYTLLDGTVMPQKTFPFYLQDNGKVSAPYASVAGQYAVKNQAAAEALAARLENVSWLRPGAIVRGKVLDKPGGKGVGGVTVAIAAADYYKQSRETITDANGDYVFKNVPPSKTDYYLRPAKFEPSSAAQGVNLVISATDIGTTKTAGPMYNNLVPISGRITDAESHAPLPGMNVVLEGPAMAHVQTDAEGRYRFLVQPGRVTISCGPYSRQYPQPHPLTLTASEGKAINDADFALKSAPYFVVDVVDAGGKPAANMKVGAWVKMATTSPGITNSIFSGPMMIKEGYGTTDAAGHASTYINEPKEDTRQRDKTIPIDVTVYTRSDDLATAGAFRTAENALDKPDVPLRIQLRPADEQLFTLTDGQGKPVAGASFDSRETVGGDNLMGSLSGFPLRYEDLGAGHYRALGLIPGISYQIVANHETGPGGAVLVRNVTLGAREPMPAK